MDFKRSSQKRKIYLTILSLVLPILIFYLGRTQNITRNWTVRFLVEGQVLFFSKILTTVLFLAEEILIVFVLLFVVGQFKTGLFEKSFVRFRLTN